jgi:hypothetical protein
MATTTIQDLPLSRAMDYEALTAVRGGGGAPWVFGAFVPFARPSESVAPIIFNQFNQFNQITNFIADNLTLQFQNINVENFGANSNINVNAGQNALTFAPTLALPQP